MICDHLRPLELALVEAGFRETFRGKPWSDHCREWAYFACCIDTDAVAARFAFPACVKAHAHRGTHDGSERGFVCTACEDGVMGAYEEGAGAPLFRG